MTIVELLIALVVILIAFSALASTIIASLGSIRNNEARVRGVALANEAVEEMASIPWDQLGLFESDPELKEKIDALPDGQTPALDPDALTLESEGEAVVLLIEEADAIPAHEQSITRDNRTYVVERWVTWYEEDGQPELKRMIAVVSWNVDGDAVSIRSDGLRAPDVDELSDLEVAVAVTSSEDPESAVALTEYPDDGTKIGNDTPFVVTGTFTDVPSTTSVKLQFRDRYEVLRSVTNSDIEPGALRTRDWSIAAHEYEFRHGQTAFTVFATSADGQIASDTGTFRFYQELLVRTPVVRQDGEPITEVTVNQNQQVCGSPVVVEVAVEGMAPGEATSDAAYNGGLDLRGEIVEDPESGKLFLGLVSEENFGGIYRVAIDELDVEETIIKAILDDADDTDRHRLDLEIYAKRIASESAFDADNYDEPEPVPLDMDVVAEC